MYLYDAWIAMNILLSASLYLFEFSTDVLALKEVQHLEKTQNHRLDGVFTIMLILFVVGHVSTAIILFISLPQDTHPALKAYFFPLMQLWRLVRLVVHTFTCRGVRSLESDLRPYYNALVVALQSSHQLIIQLYVTVFVPGSIRIVLSLIASFMSAAYSGGIAIASIFNYPNFRTAIAVGFAGGLYVMSSLVLRSLSCVILNSSIQPNYRVYLSFLSLGIAVNFVHLWFASSKWPTFSFSRFFHCLGFAYVAVSVGPLYPMLRRCNEENKTIQAPMSRNEIRIRVLLAMASHLLLDGVIFGASFSFLHKQSWWSPKCRHPLWEHLKEPYMIIYTGQFCETYIPRFFYGLLVLFFSVAVLLVLERKLVMMDRACFNGGSLLYLFSTRMKLYCFLSIVSI